jgi:hypothetical protein
VVELPFGNVAVMICYDLEFPEWVRLAALAGADLIAVPVAWSAAGTPAPSGERSGEVVAAQAAAASNGVFIAIADRCGTERGVDWLGGSVIVRRGGYPAAGPVCENRPAVLTAAIDLRQARDKRISEQNDLFADRRPDLYERLCASGLALEPVEDGGGGGAVLVRERVAVIRAVVGGGGERGDGAVADQAAQPVGAGHLGGPGEQAVGRAAVAAAFAVQGEDDQVQRAAAERELVPVHHAGDPRTTGSSRRRGRRA